MTIKKPQGAPGAPDEWINRTKKLSFTQQIKLAVAIALIEMKNLPFEQRKDLARAGLNLYSKLTAIELISGLLNASLYDEAPHRDTFSLDTLRSMAFAAWVETNLEEVEREAQQFCNLSDLIHAKGSKT